LLVRAEAEWPAIQILVEQGKGRLDREFFDQSQARIRLRTGGSIEIDREAGQARFTVPGRLTADELAHPYLGPVAAVTAHWYGRESLHGGGLALDGTVWGVVGDRLGGKSSLLAALALRGIDVVADDVLVVDGLRVFAGPRTIDLRQDAAAELAAGESIGIAGARERWRLRLEPLERALALGGWIFTAWDAEVEVRPLPAADVLVRLLANRGITVPPEDPAAFLQLSSLPAWELRRPRAWAAMPSVLELLLGRLGGA
jgi:hypothetical protein